MYKNQIHGLFIISRNLLNYEDWKLYFLLYVCSEDRVFNSVLGQNICNLTIRFVESRK